jgi:predicted permease
MHPFFQDFRQAARSILRRPLLALTVTASLALVTGCAAAVFAYLGLVLWAEVPAREPERLVELRLAQDRGVALFSYADFLAYRERNRTLEDAAAWGYRDATVDTGSATVFAWGQSISGNLFPFLGAAPHLGRLLTPADDRPGAPPNVVLSYRFWQRHYAGDSGAVGRTLRLNGTPFRIIGVTAEPAGTNIPAELYVTLAHSLLTPDDPGPASRSLPWLRIWGRLRPGVGVAAAEADLGRVAGLPVVAGAPPNRARLVPVGHRIEPGYRAELLPGVRGLMLFVGLLFALACANAANLLIPGAEDRRAEVALRAALGAGRGRMMRPFFLESLLLALLGGGFGLALATGTVAWMGRALDTTTAGMGTWGQGAMQPPLNAPVFAFAAALSLAAGLLAGLPPAWQAVSKDVTAGLRGGRWTAARRSARLRAADLLAVLQIALATALLAAAGSSVRGLGRLLSTDPGFATRNVLLVSISLPTPGSGPEPFREILREVSALPGAAGGTLIVVPPFSGWAFHVEAGRPDRPRLREPADALIVDSGAFRTFGIPLLAGRDLDPRLTADSGGEVVVSRELARRLWPEGSPIGRRIHLTGDYRGGGPGDAVVAGVAGDIRFLGLSDPPRPLLFVPLAQSEPWHRITLAIRTQGDPRRLAPAVRSLLRRRRTALVDLMPLAEQRRRSQWQAVMAVRVVSVLAALGLALAVLGMGSTLAAAVSRRRAEVGVRLALGAAPAAILRLLLLRSATCTATGLALGLTGILIWGRTLSTWLLGVDTAPEPWVTALAALIVAALSLAAAWPPAHRAAHLDPGRVLKG